MVSLLVLSGIYAFYSNDTRNLFDSTDYSIKVLFVENLDCYLDDSQIVFRNICASVTNSGFNVGDGVGDAGDHAGAVLGGGQQLD